MSVKEDACLSPSASRVLGKRSGSPAGNTLDCITMLTKYDGLEKGKANVIRRVDRPELIDGIERGIDGCSCLRTSGSATW
jgi:hypothetical protein